MPDQPAADFPCPHCLQDILLDEDTAGREVTCPHCEERVLLPKLSIAPSKPVELKPIVSKNQNKNRGRDAQPTLPLGVEEINIEPPPADPPEVERNFPLHKSTPLQEPEELELQAETEAPVPALDKSREEEIRRLAAMGAGGVDYDLAKFQQKGKLTFACPLCRRPMWVAKKDAGSIITCIGCSSEIISPKPELGLPARVAEGEDEPTPLLPKAVLPTARRVADVSLNEGQSSGRPRRLAPMPKEPGLAEAGTPVRKDRKIEPIPVKGEESLSGAPVTLPSERISTARTVGGKRAMPAPEPVAEPQPEPVVKPRETKQTKGAVRLNNQRRVFAPQKEIESDLEVTESWGQAEAKEPVSRRYVIIGWLVMIPILLGLLIWGMKEVFRKKPDPVTSVKSQKVSKNEADVVRVAQNVLKKFHDAKTIDEMAKYVRHPEITKARMDNWYHRPFVNQRLEAFGDAQVSNIEGIDFIVGVMQLAGEKPSSVALELPSEDVTGEAADNLLIDWESMVYWSEVSWDDFMAQQGEKAVDFRVTLRREAYPNVPYDDDTRWVCFKINHPSGGYCYGYVEVNSESFTAMIQPMRRANEAGIDSLNATVRLRFRADARGRKNFVPQVTIEKFTDGWLLPHEKNF